MNDQVTDGKKNAISPGKVLRKGSGTQAIFEELKKLMSEIAAKAAEAAAAKAVVNAENRMSEIVQNALEAYISEEELPDSEAEPDLVEAVSKLTESERAKRKAPRVRIGPGVKLGSMAMAKVGNGYLPVRIKSGPFKFEGKSLYKVERLTPGKDFTSGMKPLESLYEFLEEDAELLAASSPTKKG